MAVVLDALASCALKMLTKMVNDEVAKMLGVTNEINKLIIKLKFLKSFLSDVDKRNITEEVVEVWVKELRDAMCEATVIMDLLQLMGMKLGPQLKTGRMNSLAISIRNPRRAHDISSRIENLNKKLDLITACSGSYNFQKLNTDDMKRHVASSSLVGRQESGDIVRSDVVGEKIEEDTINLVEMLIKEEEENKHEDTKIKILAIVGVGGIGKTTLAKMIFNNNIIQAKFTKKIWLSVNRDFTPQDLLSKVVIEASGDHKEAYGVPSLERTLKASLEDHKTLLVMDDVWDHRAWEDVLRTPLKNSVGLGTGIIRVLVTTRIDTVAQRMKANKPYYHVDKLQPEDSWSLLRMLVVGNENGESGIDELKDIGMRIIEKCDYLPLAVKVVGGILGQKSISESVWQDLLDDFTRSVPKLPEELNRAVYLSYQDLDPSLKQCFLHYSLLPKWMDVHVDSIVAMWISEGFVDDNSFKLEELGRKYYDELISRNLIEPNTKHLNQSICSMHDVVRLFGQHVARGEARAAHMGQMCTCALDSQKLRQLCLVTIGFESNELAWTILRAQRSLRTLVLVGPIKMNPGDSWGIFSSLRILDLSLWNNANCDELVESLYRLKHLRYLSMERCGISMLPKKLGKMKLLQYINISQNESLVALPPGIVDLCQLRSLDLRGTGIINGVTKLFNKLKCLRMLEGFPAYMDDDDKWCSLEELKDLNLLMVLAIDGLVNVTKSSFAKKARLGEKGCLIRLQLSCKSKIGGDNGFLEEHDIAAKRPQQIVEVFDELIPPPCLEQLEITDYFGLRLPRWLMMSTPELPALRNLRFLLIHNLYRCTELPDGLCQLPFLELLQIVEAPCIKWVGPEFLNPTSLHRHNNFHVEKSAFPRLHKLNLGLMKNWEKWEWDQQVKAMPNIEVLFIGFCKLRRLPPGLAFHASALRELHVHNVEHLSSLEDFVSVNHLEVSKNPLLERIGNLPKLQELIITECPKMKMLDGVPKLQKLELKDDSMKTLPSYLKDVQPRHLLLDCSFWLLVSVTTGERRKLYHIQHVNAYAKGEGNPRKWYVLYTRNPLKFETNMRFCDHHYHAQEEHHVNIHSDEGSNQVMPVDGTAPVGVQFLRRYTRFSLTGAVFILLLAASLQWVLQKIHGQREQ